MKPQFILQCKWWKWFYILFPKLLKYQIFNCANVKFFTQYLVVFRQSTPSTTLPVIDLTVCIMFRSLGSILTIYLQSDSTCHCSDCVYYCSVSGIYPNNLPSIWLYLPLFWFVLAGTVVVTDTMHLMNAYYYFIYYSIITIHSCHMIQ